MNYPLLPYGKMVTVLHRVVSGRDEFGNDTYTSTPVTVGPCSVQQGSSRENLSFNDQTVTGITAFLPYGTEIGYLDAIVVDGVTYEVAGVPSVWQSPFSGNTAPVRVDATAVNGASSLCRAICQITKALAGFYAPRTWSIWSGA